MRKILATALATAALAAVAPSQASEPIRTVTGTILAPTVRDSESLVFAPPPGPVAKHARCVYLATKDATGNGDDSNGLVGWHVSIDPETEGNGEHAYTLDSDAGNISVYFYDGLGFCEGNASSTGEGNTDGGESGAIPLGTTDAIIVVEDAPNVTFSLKLFG